MKVEIKNIRREPDGKWTYDFTAEGKVNMKINLEQDEVTNFDVKYVVEGEVYGNVMTGIQVKIAEDVRVDPETFKRIKALVEKEVIPQIKEVLKIS